MRHAFLVCLCALSCTGGLTAQQFTISGKASPNPANVGQPVGLTLDATRSVALRSGCGLTSVRAGSPRGPIVWQPFLCPAVIIPVGPGGTTFNVGWSGNDTRGNPVAPGLYFMELAWSDLGFRTGSDFIPVRVDAPGAPPLPTLSTTGPVSPGTVVQYDLTDAANAGQPYIVAASFTTNVGQTIAGVPVALDDDFVFGLSFPNPDPNLFAGLSGLLDGAGTALAAVVLPNTPVLDGLQLSVQGFVIDAVSGNVVPTNPVTCPIR